MTVLSAEDSGRRATITVQRAAIGVLEINCGVNSCGGCLLKINTNDTGVPCDAKQLTSHTMATASVVASSVVAVRKGIDGVCL